MMTPRNRNITASARNVCARWREHFLVALLLATFGATANAEPLTFNDPSPTKNDTFGGSVALDGNRVLVGAPRDETLGNDVGQAHLFDATTGNLLQTFNNPSPTKGEQFGYSVALDGNNVLIGERDRFNFGHAYLFDVVTGNLLRTFNDPTVTGGSEFGRSVAIDGNSVLISDQRDVTLGEPVGQAHLFDATTGNLLQTFNNPDVSKQHFGSATAIDGDQVLIGGGRGTGTAYLFDATTGNLLRTFSDPTFSGTVALDGNRVLFGTWGGAGQAYMFDATTGNLLQTFNDPTGGSTYFGGLRGTGLALDGNNVLIGDHNDNTLGDRVGQAHLFDATTGNLLRTFNDPTPTESDLFGTSVALDGDSVLIGASWDDTLGNDVGQAYLFTIPEPASWTLLMLGVAALFVGRRKGGTNQIR